MDELSSPKARNPQCECPGKGNHMGPCPLAITFLLNDSAG